MESGTDSASDSNCKNLCQIEDRFHVRDLTTADLDQYDALLRYAFQVTEDSIESAGWEDDDIKQSKFPVLERADILGCFDGEQLASQIAVYPLCMNIYSKIRAIGFITSVSTYPEYSGNGLMRNLMMQSLTRMRKKHQSLALLYPFSIPLYRKFGWEIISNKISYQVRDDQLPMDVEAEGYVRRTEWDNQDFVNLHAQFAKQTHGCLFRNELAWEEYWRWDEEDTVVAVYYSASGVPTGYMVYLIKEDTMYIKEMIYLNRDAQKGLWEYICAHESMISEVKGCTYFNEPIAFYMNDGDIKEMIRPYVMGRIIDIEQFLEDYPCSPSADPVCITFEVEDPFLPWNNRTLNVLFEGGRCRVTDQPAEYYVQLSIGTLTTLLLGYKSATQLYRAERIRSDSEAVRILDRTLFHEVPYISDFI